MSAGLFLHTQDKSLMPQMHTVKVADGDANLPVTGGQDGSSEYAHQTSLSKIMV